jgi:acyl-CoA synthetase (AMP-forming)/AMP-acid ligase II
MEDRIVMVDSGTGLCLTERQLDERSAAATVQLRRRGVRAGDAVLICLCVGPDLLVATDAVIAAGAIVWPLPAELDQCRLREMVAASRARLMISDLPQALEAVKESLVRVVVSVEDLHTCPGVRVAGRGLKDRSS